MSETIRLYSSLIRSLPALDETEIHRRYLEALAGLKRKIVVLDDDPTGVQTVHDVNVYTDWTEASIRRGFASPDRMFFLLTNSRAMSAEKSRTVHLEIATRVAAAARERGIPYLLVSRGDSTLRGHYPLETDALREALEEAGEGPVDGEILMPFFAEGGRYTIDNIHYVREGDSLIPAAQTEFARDTSFGYHVSDLRAWVEEKTHGQWRREDVVSISLEELRQGDGAAVVQKLIGVSGFGKIVVNAAAFSDVEAFVTALARALSAGKRFLFRSAAALPKTLGGIEDRPLLRGSEMIDGTNPNGGLIVVGSHVEKTTRQLNELRVLKELAFIEFDLFLLSDSDAFRREWQRVKKEAEWHIARGITTVIYTSRRRIEVGSDQAERLEAGMRIANAVTDLVTYLEVRPSFLIAKGGITSSEIGTRGLGVQCARVMGQILKGVPVWRTDAVSKFPFMPYIIFPGNVGGPEALREAVEKLLGSRK